MSDYNLKQVKVDLETIRAAAGISEVPMRHDLLGNILIAAAGLITASWAMASHGMAQLWGLAAVLLPVGYVIWLRTQHRESGDGSPEVRREFAAAGRVLLLAVPFVGYALWAQWMGIRPMLVLATSIFFVGTLMLGGVMARPRNPGFAPWCLALMVGALALPSTTLSPGGLILFTLAAGGFGSPC